MAIEQLNTLFAGFNQIGATTSSRSVNPIARSDSIAEAEASSQTSLDPVSRLKDIGVREFVDEDNRRKLEEIRQKILADLGINSETFENMSPSEQAALESRIADAIRQRLETGQFINDGTDGLTNAPGSGPAEDRPSFPNSALSAPQNANIDQLLDRLPSQSNAQAADNTARQRELERQQIPQLFSILT